MRRRSWALPRWAELRTGVSVEAKDEAEFTQQRNVTSITHYKSQIDRGVGRMRRRVEPGR